ncbi:MAG: methyltransferase family protein [Candidatus Binatia bacterium]
MFRNIYWFFSHLGLMTVSASFILGFSYDAQAPMKNISFDILLYAAFIAIHILMTVPAFKRLVFGRPEGAPFERRIYITVSVMTWLTVFYLHRPVPGLGYASPAWLQFLGLCAVLLSFLAFFEFATFEHLSSLLGVPGSDLSHSTGGETPLLTEGPYASVRHPMYRAFFFMALSSLLLHAHAGQLLFAVMVIASFLGFIPFEERQLIKRRGDEYRDYMRRTPYRVFRGIW